MDKEKNTYKRKKGIFPSGKVQEDFNFISDS